MLLLGFIGVAHVARTGTVRCPRVFCCFGEPPPFPFIALVCHSHSVPLQRDSGPPPKEAKVSCCRGRSPGLFPSGSIKHCSLMIHFQPGGKHGLILRCLRCASLCAEPRCRICGPLRCKQAAGSVEQLEQGRARLGNPGGNRVAPSQVTNPPLSALVSGSCAPLGANFPPNCDRVE